MTDQDVFNYCQQLVIFDIIMNLCSTYYTTFARGINKHKKQNQLS